MPAAALFETFPRIFCSSAGLTITAQTLRLVAIQLPAGVMISSITFLAGNQAIVTGAHQIFGLYDDNAGSSSGTGLSLLRGTSDDTSTAWSANAIKTLALTAPYTTTRPGFYYLGILVDAATTPSLTAVSGNQQASGLAPILTGNSTTSVTALPAVAGALTANSTLPYAYVS